MKQLDIVVSPHAFVWNSYLTLTHVTFDLTHVTFDLEVNEFFSGELWSSDFWYSDGQTDRQMESDA